MGSAAVIDPGAEEPPSGVAALLLLLAGGMAEWSMAVVLKTTKVQAFGGSNPSPSASV